jgi:hypothetical protein
MAIIETRQKKHGIQSINLIDYFPNFIDDCKKERVSWQKANEDISSRIQTFLILIAKIKYEHFRCYCCIYPHDTSSEYIVFVDIDEGSYCLLLTTLRDRNIYPNSARRIPMLEKGLLLLDTPMETLLNLRQEMPDQPHPAG